MDKQQIFSDEIRLNYSYLPKLGEENAKFVGCEESLKKPSEEWRKAVLQIQIRVQKHTIFYEKLQEESKILNKF